MITQNALLNRLTRLPLRVFLTADTPGEVLTAAFGKQAVLGTATALDGHLYFAILEFQERLYALFFGDDLAAEEDWGSPTVRSSIAIEALTEPLAGPAVDVISLLEMLADRDDEYEEVPETWPTGHLLRLLLALAPADQRDGLYTLLGLRSPRVAQLLDAQARLAVTTIAA